jgi:hypothetical protein
MTKPWHLHEEANEEMTAAARWYEARESGLGDDFLRRIDETVRELERMPTLGSAMSGVDPKEGVRRWLVSRFPYQIIWVELDDEYRILAIAHLRRRADYWHGRLPR